MKLKKNTGFTLIELMIVILIISIIMAFAVPSYRDYVLKAKRSEAHTALLQIASLQERNYANLNKYGSDDDLGLGTSHPAPTTANKLNYTITMTGSDTTYTIKAAAYGGQTKDTACVIFTLDHLGAKTPVTGDCW
jgi:type IV pilus assembly protein PilE